MSIANLPVEIQNAIQTGMLQTAFESPLLPKMGYRHIADQESFPARIGQTITKTRAGLLPAITTPVPPAANTDITSGLTPQNWAIEQYTLALNQWMAQQMVNVVTTDVAIASIFLKNAFDLAVQAQFSVDTLAYNEIMNAYMGGNTHVITTIAAAQTTIHVDNIDGFETVFNGDGAKVPISSTNPLNVQFQSGTVYSLVGSGADATNVSVTPGGTSGTLTFSTAVAISDGTAGQAVVSAVAPLVMRPYSTSGVMAPTTLAISGSDMAGGKLTMQMLLNARAQLQSNGVQPFPGGSFRFICSPQQAVGLYQDPAFQMLYRGVPNTEVFQGGRVTHLLGIDVIESNLNIAQSVSGVGMVQRGIMVGRGALIESTFTNNGYAQAVHSEDDRITIVDGIAHIIREPIDAALQVVTQTWSYIGGFVAPTDMTTNPQTIPTASNAYYKRGALIESL